MGTPLLFLGLVVLWAAVLIPATRSSRTGDERRSVDAFSKGMRTLSRRSATAAATERMILIPTRSVTDVKRKAEHSRVLRRRRVFLVLGQAVGITLVLAAVLGGPWLWVNLVLDAGLVGWVYALRRRALVEAELARRARRQRMREREERLREAYLARREAESARIVRWPTRPTIVFEHADLRAVND